jgi:chromate reductase, NAD(P)H dehydrogenase (quinone)
MITVISSTNRKNSYSLRVANEISVLLADRKIHHQLFSLEELPENFAFTQINDAKDDRFDALVEKNIINADKFIFVIAEYHGGFPGILKSFIDSVSSKHFKEKKAALVGVASGRGGALRALDHFTSILHYLQVEVLSDKPKMSGVENLFDDKNRLKDEVISKRLAEMCDKFERF